MSTMFREALAEHLDSHATYRSMTTDEYHRDRVATEALSRLAVEVHRLDPNDTRLVAIASLIAYSEDQDGVAFFGERAMQVFADVGLDGEFDGQLTLDSFLTTLRTAAHDDRQSR